MGIIKYFVLKILYIIELERNEFKQQLALLEEYFSAPKCKTCNGIRLEHSVCKECKL